MILQRTALYPQMRFDSPDARAMEAFGQNDWTYFLKGILSDKSLIVSGFDITNYSDIFTVPGVLLQQNNVALIHPEATTQASGFYVSSGTEADFRLVLSTNNVSTTTNYVELDLTVQTGSPDIRAFWDPGANGGDGAEFTDTVDTVINLNLDVEVNISGFTAGRIPLYKIVTNPDGTVNEITDCRPMFFRLGTGGTSPNPEANYQWPEEPTAAQARMETPVTANSATAANAPFLGGDKNLKNFKDWMDAVMSLFKETNSTPYWYMKPKASTAQAYQNVAMILMTGGVWEHLAGTPGHLKLTTGTTIVRLGQNNSALEAFTDINLITHNNLYVFLSTDGSTVSYGMGDDGATPIIPKAVSLITNTSITVATGGNYVTTGGKIIVRGQEFDYSSYNAGTGTFLAVTPDPTGLAQVGNSVYQANDGSDGFYHTSVSADMPSISGGISEAVEQCFWVAHFDGVNTIIIRDSELVPGESAEVGDDTSEQLYDFIGSTGPADDAPQYSTDAIPDGTNLVEGVSAASKIAELAREYQNLFIHGGGNFEWEGTQGADTLAWSSTIYIDIADRASQYSISAGNVTLTEGQAAYVVIPDAVPGGPLTVIVADIDDVPVDSSSVGWDNKILTLFLRRNNKIIGHQTLPTLESGEIAVLGQDLSNQNRARLGILTESTFSPYASVEYITEADDHAEAIGKLDTELRANADRDNQDRAMKLISGGTWTNTAGTLSWSADAYVQIPGQTDARNTIPAGNIALAAGDVAYVTLNRSPGVAANLTVTAAAASSLVLNDYTFIVARRDGSDILVGPHSFLLVPGESKKLDAGISDQNRDFLMGDPFLTIDESDSDPQWATRGAPLRNITSTDSVTNAVVSLDAELDKFFGQLQLREHLSSPKRVKVTGVDKTMLNGSALSLQLQNLLLKFEGAEIDFSTGSVFEDDGITALGVNFTPATIAASQYRWYSVTLVANTVESDNRITGQLIIIPADADGASKLAAPRAVFTKGLRLGQVVVQQSGGDIASITQDDIVQLGVGSSGSEDDGGDGILQPIPGYQWLETDGFTELSSSSNYKIEGTNYTNATFDFTKTLFKMSCDKGRTVATNAGTAITIDASPSFTVKIGDIVYVTSGARSGQWRRISAVSSQTSFTLDAAFAGGDTTVGDTLMLSQAVWTKDLVNFGSSVQKTRARDAFSSDVTQIAIDYEDSVSAGDDVPDFMETATVVVSASNEGLVTDVTIPLSNTFSPYFARPSIIDQADDYILSTNANQKRLHLVFFPNPANGTVTSAANVLGYECSFHPESDYQNGGVLDSAFCITDGSGTENNCLAPTVVGGKTQIQLNWSYVPNVNQTKTRGQLRVIFDGDDIPRFTTGVVGSRYYKEIQNSVTGVWDTIELDSDWSAVAVPVEIIRSEGIVDTSNQNSGKISALMSAIVGTPSQLAAGIATHSSLATAITDVASGGTIRILPNVSLTENITLNKKLTIEGGGHSSNIDGTFTFDSSSDYSLVRAIRINGNVTFNAGADGIFFREIFLSNTASLVDSGTANSKLVIQE